MREEFPWLLKRQQVLSWAGTPTGHARTMGAEERKAAKGQPSLVTWAAGTGPPLPGCCNTPSCASTPRILSAFSPSTHRHPLGSSRCGKSRWPPSSRPGPLPARCWAQQPRQPACAPGRRSGGGPGPRACRWRCPGARPRLARPRKPLPRRPRPWRRASAPLEPPGHCRCGRCGKGFKRGGGGGGAAQRLTAC